MNSKYYKYCVVPQCGSTTIKTPNKLFIYVPNNKQIRTKWLKLARRDPKYLSSDSRIYFCENHFDLPNDMENYMMYHIKGFVSQIRMKPGCMPSKFECQPDWRKRTCSSIERPYILKKQKTVSIDECPNESVDTYSTQNLNLENTSDTSSATTVTSSGLHEGFRCNSCSGDIVGFRYTCVECVDCDLCALCEVRGMHAQHYVLRVPGPRPHTEVRAMVDRIRREVLNVLQPPEVGDADSVKVEVKMEADSGPDPLLVAAASTCTSAALSEPQIETPFLDDAVWEVKVKIESDDETAMDIGDTVVMSHTGQIIHDEQEAVVPEKSSPTQNTPSARQKKTSATKKRARKRPAAPTREEAPKKLLLEIDSQVRQATTSAMEDTGGSSCEVFTHSKGGEVAALSLGGGEDNT